MRTLGYNNLVLQPSHYLRLVNRLFLTYVFACLQSACSGAATGMTVSGGADTAIVSLKLSPADTSILERTYCDVGLSGCVDPGIWYTLTGLMTNGTVVAALGGAKLSIIGSPQDVRGPVVWASQAFLVSADNLPNGDSAIVSVVATRGPLQTTSRLVVRPRSIRDVAVWPSNTVLRVGDSVAVSATSEDSDYFPLNREYSWSVDDSSILALRPQVGVASGPTIVARKPGSTYVRASAAGVTGARLYRVDSVAR